MNNLLINRINLRFNKDIEFYLNITKATDFSLVGNSVKWTKGKLPSDKIRQFEDWLREQELNEDDFVSFNFGMTQKQDTFSVQLITTTMRPFKRKVLLQELGRHLISIGFYIEPSRTVGDFAAYQRMGDFDEEWEQYRRIDFKWYENREELSYNIGSENTFVSRQKRPIEGAKILDEDNQLIYNWKHSHKQKPRRVFATNLINAGFPKRFNYNRRYNELKQIATEYLNTFRSLFFHAIDNPGLKSVQPSDVQRIFSRQNLMVFGGGKTSVNAALGMREYGPFKKIDNANKIQMLFIYKNRDDANNLYLYLRNGLKHFPGLLSYVGIPVALPNEDRGLSYDDAVTLPDKLEDFLKHEYPDKGYPTTIAIVIGPYKRYESEEKESQTYYKVKQMLLDKEISSQFVSNSSIRDPNFHYFLSNIAIAILAKLGGIPWKLDNKRYNELIIGFNIRKQGENSFLGSAVFFNNEGKLGLVQGFPQGSDREIINHLRGAILQYTKEFGEPDRLVIHYYKPPRKEEVKHIEFLLKDLKLTVPFAMLEINDSKSKMDVCFDAGYQMGMPESGIYVRIGRDEYLLFNNNRYEEKPVRKVEEELPIKVKIYFADIAGFHHKELISQVYEFSRLNWRGLKQKSQPVTTTYSKMIAEFSANCEGAIPINIVAQTTPWFL
ncbi:MAG: Piwi domain-containing protein [Thermodesulfobacteriota bacterium]